MKQPNKVGQSTLIPEPPTSASHSSPTSQQSSAQAPIKLVLPLTDLQPASTMKAKKLHLKPSKASKASDVQAKKLKKKKSAPKSQSPVEAVTDIPLPGRIPLEDLFQTPVKQRSDPSQSVSIQVHAVASQAKQRIDYDKESAPLKSDDEEVVTLSSASDDDRLNRHTANIHRTRTGGR